MKKLRVVFLILLMMSIVEGAVLVERASAYIAKSMMAEPWNPSTTGYPSREILFKDAGNLYALLVFSTNQDNWRPYHARIARSTSGGDAWWLMPDPQITDIDSCKAISMAIDSSSHIHLVWFQWLNENEDGHFYYKKYDGSSWSTPEQLSADMEHGGRAPVIAVDSQDHIHVAWEDEGPGTTYYRKKTGSAWSPIENLGVTGPQISMTIDYNDDVHIVGGYWMGQIKYIKCTGGTWGTIENVHDEGFTEGPRHASMVIDSSNRPHVIWVGSHTEKRDDKTIWQIYHSYRDSGTWTPRVRISEDTGKNYHDPTMAIDPNDNLYVIYVKVTQPYLEEVELCYKKKVGGSWSSETLLTPLSDKARAPLCRWTLYPAVNRVSGESDMDFVWVERATGGYDPDAYPVYFNHGIEQAPNTPTPSPSPTNTPTSIPTNTPSPTPSQTQTSTPTSSLPTFTPTPTEPLQVPALGSCGIGLLIFLLAFLMKLAYTNYRR